ncbi:MAG TPA: ATP-binding protein [Candidatus Cloacimonadota bacterium]|nr:ATP-binding protein [Candidatus Cloacimonadota bacterium]
MRRVLVPLLLLMLSGFSACRSTGRIMPRVLSPRYLQRTDDPIIKAVFADLSGNGRDLLVTAESSHPASVILKAYDHDGRLIFEHDTRQQVRDIKALANPKDGGFWIFYTHSEQEGLLLKAVRFDRDADDQHQSRSFEAIPIFTTSSASTTGNGNLRLEPLNIIDLDQDGKAELVCKLSSNIPGEARGLAVMDFGSGRLEWSLKTESNLTDVLIDDLDNDGSVEIVLGSRVEQASGNDAVPFNRSGGWLAVLGPRGDLLYSERQFQGSGEVRLASVKPAQSPTPLIFCVSNTWGPRRTVNAVSSRLWSGKKLVPTREISTSNSFERAGDHPNLAVTEFDRKPRLILIERGTGIVSYDEELKRTIHTCPDFVNEILDVKDIDLDNKPEIIARRPDRTILVLDTDLHKLAELSNPYPTADKVNVYVVGRGSGLAKGLAVYSEELVTYYGYYPVNWFTLLGRFTTANSVYFAIFMLFLLLLMIWYVIYNWQSIYTIMPALRVAVIYLRNHDRLMYCNPYFLELVRAPVGQKTRSLKALSPTLGKLLIDFRASGNRLQNHELALGEDQMAGIYRVSFYRGHNPIYRYLMIIVPVPTVNAAEKILWADTARRLSHHVRRHITNVILALPKLTDEDIDSSERKEYHQIISAEVEKIRVFTHSFQRFSELRDHDLRQHDVLPLVEHVLDHLHIQEGVKLIRAIPGSPLPAYLDPIRFEEALANLLNNALDSMPSGGYLQITAKTVASQESPKSDLRVLIEIEDNGNGIPEKYMEEIWKPFFTTKQSGTGIGLPESRKIIESMGGMITLHSEESVGTTVSIWLRVGESEA